MRALLKPRLVMGRRSMVLWFFIAAAALHLGGNFFGHENLVRWTKPFLIPLLILFFLLQVRTVQKSFTRLIVVALLFSWIGDVILMFQHLDAGFFLSGLVSFLLAHVCYIFAFRKTSVHHRQTILKENPWLALLFVIYGIGVFLLIQNGLNEMKVPVIFYMVIILLMGLAALNRFRRVEYAGFLLVFSGALCFMISDSLLAVNKFREPFSYAGFLIMLTYLAAQYLIVTGCIRQVKSEWVGANAAPQTLTMP
jgi:uncharacterized membrane protein YhhN